MPETISRGRFVWHELMTPDPEAALKFYTQVVGWKTVGDLKKSLQAKVH